ncbi:MAG: hypothetical protein ACJAX3_001698, partial [Patiriisocius sp.]
VLRLPTLFVLAFRFPPCNCFIIAGAKFVNVGRFSSGYLIENETVVGPF